MIFVSRGGCLLPLLITLNLFFGWLIFKPAAWLLVGTALILLSILNSRIAARRSFVTAKKRKDVIDVEGEVVEEKHRIQEKG